MKDYRGNYLKWINAEELSPDEKQELLLLEKDEEALRERFESELSFGTSGIRGIMRSGLKGMNTHSVMHVTQGLANYIVKHGRQADGVVIAYDSRHNSKIFAEKTSEVLAANGIKVFFFDELRPTPELSYSVRELGAVAGVNITASHNPKEYNGYKVYWEDGAQIAPQLADPIAEEIKHTDFFKGVKKMSFDEAESLGLVVHIGAEIDKKYLDAVCEQSLAGNFIAEVADEVKIVYSAFHGAGAKFVPEAMKRVGIKNIIPVAEQMISDGDFPTVPTPNPEYESNFALAIEYAKREDADAIIATDPDSDRCGALVKKGGEYISLSGNQMGILMLDYILTRKKELGILEDDAVAIRSVVSSALCDKICKAFGIECMETLTGFKYIGEKIKEFEEIGEHSFLFGFEESIGFLSGTYTRDKDGVLAAMLMAEICCFYRSKGMSVYEGLISLYEKYGYCLEKPARYRFEGYNVSERMTACMNALRENAPESMGYKILNIRDFKDGIEGFEKTDMLYYEIEGGGTVIIRPSGTEPIIKMYVKGSGKSRQEAESRIDCMLEAAQALFD